MHVRTCARVHMRTQACTYSPSTVRWPQPRLRDYPAARGGRAAGGPPRHGAPERPTRVVMGT